MPADDAQDPTTCPRCGSTLSYSMGGLCPRCVAVGGLIAFPPEGEDSRTAGENIPTAGEVAAALPEIEVGDLIGHGGMAAVFKGRQVALNRPVAIKVLAIEEAEHPEFAERFRIEAQALAKLSHPNIVAVFDFGEREEFFFIVMEYVPGTNLAELIASGKLAPAQSLDLVIQICQALQYAHDAGVIHRDIKPGNILVDAEGKVRIADFGLAKLLGHDDGQLTAGGDRLGTPLYMAPEQRTGKPGVDHRADIYSLGVVFYEMLTGQLPSGKVEPPSRRSRSPITSRVDPVVMRSMEHEPRRRFQQASEVEERVAEIQSGRSRWSLAIAAVAGMVALVWLAATLIPDGRTARSDKSPPTLDGEFERFVFEATQRATPDDVAPFERAGQSLFMRGGMLLLGAPQGINRDKSLGPGYVAVMAPDATGAWKETHRLTAPLGETGARFGHAVAADERQVMISSSSASRIYVFAAPPEKSPDEWELVQELAPPESLRNPQFGVEFALHGSTLVTGARLARSGGACVFARDEASGRWGRAEAIFPKQSSPALHFGNAVALADGIIAVSSRYLDHPRYPSCGCVDLFERGADGWEHVTRLLPHSPKSGLLAGYALAFDGRDRLLIGVVGDQVDGKNQGAVQVFQRGAGEANWKFQEQLRSPDSPHSGSFGRRIVVAGDRLFVGSDNFDPDGNGRLGCAYEFSRDTKTASGWRPKRQFLPSLGADPTWSGLGYQIAIGDEWMAFGIPVARDKAGGAYVVPIE